MGQDFRALAGHGLSIDSLERLPAMLDEITERMYNEVSDLGLNVHWETSPPATRLRQLIKPFMGDSSGKMVKTDKPIQWHYHGLSGGDFESYLRTSWEQEGAATISATSALWLAVAPQCVEIGSWVRWYEFLCQPAARITMRRLSREIVKILNGPEAEVIYVPDNAWAPGEQATSRALSGERYETAKDELVKLVGPPAPFIVSLFESATVSIGTISRSEADAYYIDRFDGLI